MSRAGLRTAVYAGTCMVALAVAGQPAYSPRGSEFRITESLIGDQVQPQMALEANGGYLVWQDNATDGDGLGISAQAVDSNFAPKASAFRVNQQAAGDQENPQVVLLKNGGAAFIWQGGPVGSQKIYARFLSPDGSFATEDLQVNTFQTATLSRPALVAMADGSLLAVWSSEGQDGSMQGIYGQKLSEQGVKMGPEFQVNQFANYNQRSPAAASLNGEQALVVWISEQQRFLDSVDVYGRVYDSNGSPVGNEFLINASTNLCAHPRVSAQGNNFVVVWSENFGLSRGDEAATNSWDILSRVITREGGVAALPVKVNSFTYGDQYIPQVTASGEKGLVVWTSLGQDGSWEGIYGRFLSSTGQPLEDEFQINTRTLNSQFQPCVGAGQAGQFLVVWSSYMGGAASFDLFAQAYQTEAGPGNLPKPSVPYVFPLSQSRLSVAWPEIGSYPVKNYGLFIDSQAEPILVTSNYYVISQLAPGSSHTVRLNYTTTDSRSSELSDPASATTWGEDLNGDGLPDDWQGQFWGPKSDDWPSSKTDTDLDGASNFKEFLAGTSPVNAQSVLKTWLETNSQGCRLLWNTQPGLVYQVQVSSGLTEWANLAMPRLATGSEDSISISPSSSASYYRIIRLR